MSSPAQSRGARKGIRDAVQAVLAVVAAGGATAAIELVVDHLNPAYGVLMAFVFKIVIAYAQNFLETAGKIPVLLPTPGLVSAVLDPVDGAATDATPLVAPPAAATVDAVTDAAGKVTGAVTDTAGGIVGKVTGLLHRGKDENGGAGMIALLVIVFFVIMAVGGFAVCDLMFDDESEPGDNHLLGRVELVSHEYDDDGGYYEEGDRNGGYGSDYGGNRRDDRNRNRGAFSPGPFDDSPVDAFNGNTICLPSSTCYADGDRRNDEREMP